MKYYRQKKKKKKKKNIIIIGYKLPAVTTHVDALIVEVSDGIVAISY